MTRRRSHSRKGLARPKTRAGRLEQALSDAMNSPFQSGPASAFHESLQIAHGFLRLKFYMQDLLEGGGKNSIQRISALLTELLTGIGLGPVFAEVTRDAKKKLKKRSTGTLEGEMPARVEAWMDQNSAEIVNYIRDTLEIKLAYERGLGLQSIVVVVAAFEDYVHTTTAQVVAAHPELDKRFEKQLQDLFGYSDLSRNYGDARKAVGDVVAHSYDFSNPEALLVHLSKLTRANIASNPVEWAEKFRLYLAYRNLAAHTAGIVDGQFKGATGNPGEVGKPVQITEGFAEGALDFFGETVSAIESALDNRGGNARFPPYRYVSFKVAPSTPAAKAKLTGRIRKLSLPGFAGQGGLRAQEGDSGEGPV
jgi:hypothetical protein